MKHKGQFVEVFGGWAWRCTCGGRAGFPPFVKRDHAVDDWKKHKAELRSLEGLHRQRVTR